MFGKRSQINLLKRLRQWFIKRFIIDDIKVVPLRQLDTLASNKVDRERASTAPYIRDAYDVALSTLREDF